MIVSLCRQSVFKMLWRMANCFKAFRMRLNDQILWCLLGFVPGVVSRACLVSTDRAINYLTFLAFVHVRDVLVGKATMCTVPVLRNKDPWSKPLSRMTRGVWGLFGVW